MNAPVKRSPDGYVAFRAQEHNSDGKRWVRAYLDADNVLSVELHTDADAEIVGWPDMVERHPDEPLAAAAVEPLRRGLYAAAPHLPPADVDALVLAVLNANWRPADMVEAT